MNKLQYKSIYRGQLPPISNENDVWALDLELADLKDNQLHRPFGRMASLAGTCDGENVYIIFEESEVQEFISRIDKSTLVFHNAVFDLGHIRRWANVPDRKAMRDIMIIERNMFSNYYDAFSLADLVRRYLGCYMEKDVRKEFHNLETAMTPEQIVYAGLDVIGTWLVDKEQQKIIDKPTSLIWDRIDKADVYTALSLSGFTLDQDLWIELKEQNQKIVDSVQEELGTKYGHYEEKIYKKKPSEKVFHPFNPDSPLQVKELLAKQGLRVPDTNDDTISQYREQYPIVATILDYRIAAKKVSTYGLSFLKNVEEDGRIYTSLNVSLPITGRDSSSSPNLQNIPRLKEYRRPFIAGAGKKLIIADYSAQEVRIFAYICKDPKLTSIINSGKDIHCEIARLAFNEIITKKENPERRNQVKSLIFGLIYGLSPAGFARDNDVELDVAQGMFDQFFETFDVAAEWYKETKYTTRQYQTSILGRKIWLHPYSYTRNTLALNAPMQSSGADMTKLSMKEFRRVAKSEIENGEVGIVLPVHDEIVLWSIESQAQRFADILVICMRTIAEKIHVGIPAEIEYHIADSWAEK